MKSVNVFLPFTLNSLLLLVLSSVVSAEPQLDHLSWDNLSTDMIGDILEHLDTPIIKNIRLTSQENNQTLTRLNYGKYSFIGEPGRFYNKISQLEEINGHSVQLKRVYMTYPVFNQLKLTATKAPTLEILHLRVHWGETKLNDTLKTWFHVKDKAQSLKDFEI